MTLATARQLARAQYGLPDSSTEDDLFANTFLTSCINEEIALIQGLGKTHFEPDLSLSLVSGTSEYALSDLLVEPNIHSFRFTLASAYTRIYSRTWASLYHQYGPLEDVASSASVAYFLLRPGEDGSASRKIVVVPKPNASGTLRYGGWIRTAAASDDGDVLAFVDAQCYLLIPGVNERMAKWEIDRGREGVDLNRWETDTTNARTDLLRQFGVQYKPPRAAEVALPSQVGAEERRRAAAPGGA